MDRTPKISSTDLLYNVPGYSNLLQALLNPNYIKQQKWLSQPYIHNNKYQKTLRFKTSAGITVRSKSETLIVRGLSDYKIPFKCILVGQFLVILPHAFNKMMAWKE
jgi:hypothetical protein